MIAINYLFYFALWVDIARGMILKLEHPTKAIRNSVKRDLEEKFFAMKFEIEKILQESEEAIMSISSDLEDIEIERYKEAKESLVKGLNMLNPFLLPNTFDKVVGLDNLNEKSPDNFNEQSSFEDVASKVFNDIHTFSFSDDDNCIKDKKLLQMNQEILSLEKTRQANQIHSFWTESIIARYRSLGLLYFMRNQDLCCIDDNYDGNVNYTFPSYSDDNNGRSGFNILLHFSMPMDVTMAFLYSCFIQHFESIKLQALKIKKKDLLSIIRSKAKAYLALSGAKEKALIASLDDLWLKRLNLRLGSMTNSFGMLAYMRFSSLIHSILKYVYGFSKTHLGTSNPQIHEKIYNRLIQPIKSELQSIYLEPFLNNWDYPARIDIIVDQWKNSIVSQKSAVVNVKDWESAVIKEFGILFEIWHEFRDRFFVEIVGVYVKVLEKYHLPKMEMPNMDFINFCVRDYVESLGEEFQKKSQEVVLKSRQVLKGFDNAGFGTFAPVYYQEWLGYSLIGRMDLSISLVTKMLELIFRTLNESHEKDGFGTVEDFDKSGVDKSGIDKDNLDFVNGPLIHEMLKYVYGKRGNGTVNSWNTAKTKSTLIKIIHKRKQVVLRKRLERARKTALETHGNEIDFFDPNLQLCWSCRLKFFHLDPLENDDLAGPSKKVDDRKKT